MDFKIRDQTIELLKSDINEPSNESSSDKHDRLEAFREWLDDLYFIDSDNIKSVLLGCAMFKRDQQLNNLFADSEDEKDTAKFKVELCQIYLDLASQYLACL